MKNIPLKTVLMGVFSIVLLLMMPSCIKDDLKHCGLKVRFRYVYNMQEVDRFAEEVSRLRLWIFDAAGELVEQYTAAVTHEEGYALQIDFLPRGKYTFVAMAEGTEKREPLAHFDISDMQKGMDLESLTARLRRNERRVNDTEVNVLLNGVAEVDLTGCGQTISLDMMKCTHTLRICLATVNESVSLDEEDLDIYIEGKNGWLAYDASTYQSDEIIYSPYRQEILKESILDKPQQSNCLVTEISTSRLCYEMDTRLVIRHHQNKSEILNINLPRLLSLQGIGERRRGWSLQEYLDRQDNFTLVFITDGCTWMQGYVIVNGWVLDVKGLKL